MAEPAEQKATAKNESAGPRPWIGLLVPGGVVLLTLGMILVVAGVAIAPLFRPGTWLILLAFVVIAAGGLVRLANSNDA